MLSLGTKFIDTEIKSVRSELKTALYALVEMIERWDVGGGNGGSSHGHHQNDVVLEIEQVKDFNKLVKSLAEIEQFYDCIGGIIG